MVLSRSQALQEAITSTTGYESQLLMVGKTTYENVLETISMVECVMHGLIMHFIAFCHLSGEEKAWTV